jgi:hypothetical protein
MIPRHIWRYINDNTTSSQHATTAEMPSRSVEDQEDSESNKNKPPPPPVSPRKKKSSKRRKKETKRKHGDGDPDGSDYEASSLKKLHKFTRKLSAAARAHQLGTFNTTRGDIEQIKGYFHHWIRTIRDIFLYQPRFYFLLTNHWHKQVQYYILHGAGTVPFHLHRQIIQRLDQKFTIKRARWH